MALTTAELNTAAGAAAARLTHISLHTGNPGSTGASEASGGSPAYARKALSFGSATGGATEATEVTFDVPAGTYTHFGCWSAGTGGTFRGGGALAASQTLSGQGTVKVTLTLTAA